MEELNALVSRLKAIVTEIEVVIGSQPKKKATKEEYLAMDDNQKETYHKEQMEAEEQSEGSKEEKKEKE